MKKLKGLAFSAVFLFLVSSGVRAGVIYTMEVDGPGSNADFVGLTGLTGLTLEGSCALATNFSACRDSGDGGGTDPTDWYSWIAPANGQLSVSIFFTNSLMDIDVALLESNGNLLASSATINDVESIEVEVVMDATYFINVYSFRESGSNDAYSADRFEKNNSLNSAAALNPAPAAPVPESSTLALMGLGLVGLGWWRRKKS